MGEAVSVDDADHQVGAVAAGHHELNIVVGVLVGPCQRPEAVRQDGGDLGRAGRYGNRGEQRDDRWMENTSSDLLVPSGISMTS